MDDQSFEQIFKDLPNFYSDLENILEYKKLNKGMANLNFIVNTKNNKYFLKIIPSTQKQTFPRQIAFYENIHITGIQTVAPIKNVKQQYFTEINQQSVLLYPYREIIEPTVDLTSAKAIGELVGRLHNTVVNEHQLETARYTKLFYQQGLSFVDEGRKKRYAKYTSYINSLDDTLPKGFVFDDICTDNLYANAEGIVGFIDPENAGYGEFVFDVAGALIMCFFDKPDRELLIKSFFDGYNNHRQLTNHEKEYLFESLIFICVLLALFFELQQGEKNIDRINLRLDYADALIEAGKEKFTVV